MQCRLILTALLSVTLSLCAKCACAAPSEACVAPYPTQYFRDLGRYGDSARVWLAAHGEQVDLCISLSDCVWRLADVLAADLGAFSDLAGETRRCGNSDQDIGWTIADRVFRSNCEMPTDLRIRLAASAHWLSGIVGKTSCGSAGTPLTDMGFIIKTAAGPVLTLQARSAPMCLVLGIPLGSTNGTFAFLAPSCPTNRSEIELLNSRYWSETVRLHPDVSWLGAGIEASGFAIAANNTLQGYLDTPPPSVWGNAIDKDYVSGWLKRAAAAAAGSDELAQPDDPLPASKRDDFGGRLAKWLTAGLSRISSKPFTDEWRRAQSFRDWMARNVLTGSAKYNGTLLRGELARTDWH